MYSRIAQYYDAAMARAHADADAQIETALSGIDTSEGPILDIGSGTGLTVSIIARALPSAEIFAIEPDASMRGALMTRVWADPDVRERVTILPMLLHDAPLPGTISGAVLSASLVHLSPDERQQTWALLAARLAPTGRIIVEVQCPDAVDIPEMEVARERVGRVEYHCRAKAQRTGDDRLQWTMTYRGTIGDAVVSEDIVTMTCWTVSQSALIAEAEAFNLVGRSVGDLVLLTKK